MLIQLVLLVLCYKRVDSFRKVFDVFEIRPNTVPAGTVVFFHGAGDTGPGLKRWINLVMGRTELFKDMNVIFPTAPIIKPIIKNELAVGSTKGKEHHTWFDERYYVYRGSEDMPGIHRIALDIVDVMKNESARGIPLNKIFLGGFGMGGNMAMHIAYRYATNVGGVFGLSTFAKRHSAVYRGVRLLKKDKKTPFAPAPLFLCMTEKDLEIDPICTLKTFKRMRRLGVDVKLFSMIHAFHEIKKEELLEVQKWIDGRLKGNLDLMDEFDKAYYESVPGMASSRFTSSEIRDLNASLYRS